MAHGIGRLKTGTYNLRNSLERGELCVRTTHTFPSFFSHKGASMDTYRVYYWFLGAPEERRGGPWWYHDFDNDASRQCFIDEMKLQCHKMKIITGKKSSLPTHTLFDVKPPEGAREVV